MTIERVFYCNGPDCEAHARTARRHATTFLTVTSPGEPTKHFCSWDCVLRHAATLEPTTTIQP